MRLSNLTNPKVVDMCITTDKKLWDIFRTLIEEAATGGDTNSKNYGDLESRVHDHDAFHMLLNGDDPVGFAGLYNNDIYSPDVARALNRAYYAKAWRQTGLTSNKRDRKVGGLLTRYVLPFQVEVARPTRRMLFFSIQNNRKNTVRKIAEWINKYDRQLYKPYTEEWVPLDGLYFTCPETDICHQDRTCWQYVAALSFDDCEFPLRRITEDERTAQFGY